MNNLDKAKRKETFLKILKAIVFSSLLGLLFHYNIKRPRVMILHSYDPTMDIVRDFDNGVRKVLENQIEPLVHSYYLNMVSKNTIKKKIDAGNEARVSVDRFRPKVLVAVGDEAQEFVAKFYLNHEKIKVIFAGVKGDIKKFNYIPGKNVGGVIEVSQIQELNTFISMMLPEKKNIKVAHLGDTSMIVHLIENILMRYPWKNVWFYDSLKVADTENFKRAAILLNDRCDVLLISSYKGLKSVLTEEDEIISDEIMKWVLHNTTIPIVSIFGYPVEEGAGAAIVSSAYEQGILAMNLALKMLNKCKEFENLYSEAFSVYINARHIKERKIYVSSIYKSFAIGTQKLYEGDASEIGL